MLQSIIKAYADAHGVSASLVTVNVRITHRGEIEVNIAHNINRDLLTVYGDTDAQAMDKLAFRLGVNNA